MMTAKSKKSISDDQRLAVVIAAYLRAVEEGQSPDRDDSFSGIPSSRRS